MTSTDLALTGDPARTPARRRAEPDVYTPTGMRLTGAAAQALRESVPHNSYKARKNRRETFEAWCTENAFATDASGAVVSYLADLGDRGHPSTVLEAHLGTLRAWRTAQGRALDKVELMACHQVIKRRTHQEADDPEIEPGPLQADAVTPDELRQMLRALDRTTVRGIRDAVTLLVDWWMAGRQSEPARLNLHDVKIVTVRVKDPVTGQKVPRKALIIKIRRSKADQHARGQEVRILASDDEELCPVRAVEDWLRVLEEDCQRTPGPLIRRVDRHGNIGAKAAGRHTKDPLRRGGITGETVGDIITAAARAAELTTAPTPEEREAAREARQQATEAAAAADTAEEANAILKAYRRTVRAARAAVRRITGHSMRRGCIQALLAAGHPPEVVALHSRHSPHSSAFDAYRPKKLSWSQNPTLGLALAA